MNSAKEHGSRSPHPIVTLLRIVLFVPLTLAMGVFLLDRFISRLRSRNTNIWRWLGRAYQAWIEAHRSEASWKQLMRAVTTAAVGIAILEIMEDVVNDVEDAVGKLRSRHDYYQLYWWLLVDTEDSDDLRLPYSERPSQTLEWPPFIGHRFALGGDRP